MISFYETFNVQPFLVIADRQKDDMNSTGKAFRVLFHYRQCTIFDFRF